MEKSFLANFGACAPQGAHNSPRNPLQGENTICLKTTRSAETGVSLGVARAGVGLDVGLLDASAGTEMSLGLAHGGSSEEEGVGACDEI